MPFDISILTIVLTAMGSSSILGVLCGLAFSKIPHRLNDIVLGFAAGIMLALFLYAAILPRLVGFMELGGVIFFLSFTMAWLLPLPEQGMARMGMLLPVFVLSGAGGEVLSPAGFLAGATGLLCAALGVSLVFYMMGHLHDRF